MSVKVVDASAIAAVLLEESSADAIQARIAGQQLTGPMILGFEFCNVCVVKARRYPEKRDIFREALDVFHSMAIWMQAISAADVFILTERHTLSAYDASYLWLALELDAELVTLDAKLERAYAALARS